jgi:ATP phosphoribosyltransferase regulatory subunit
VGAVFAHDSDRDRPAVGFSVDLKTLVRVAAPRALKPAIRAPWSDEADLAEAVARLRREGETVIHVLPGHAHEIDEFACDRQLVKVGGGWQVQTVAA